jgi:hypothetical protein
MKAVWSKFYTAFFIYKAITKDLSGAYQVCPSAVKMALFLAVI